MGLKQQRRLKPMLSDIINFKRIENTSDQDIDINDVNLFDSKTHIGIRESSDGTFIAIPKNLTGKDLSEIYIFQANDFNDLFAQFMERTYEPITAVSTCQNIKIGIINATK